jgi:ribulose-5-phosphate 4-epimerase/fuculose-1-phosphate aldolase
MNAALKPEVALSTSSAANHYHPDEWKARIELAACYRVFAMLGWTEMIYNHITVRVPGSVSGTEKHFLINPFGLHYSEVTASNLIKIDLQGNKLSDSPHPINPAGFTVHSTIHNALSGAHCIMHTHTTSGVAVACTQGGLAQNNFYSAQLHGRVAYHDFEGITIHADEGPRLLKSMADKPAVILRNHGLLTYGASLPQAFVLLWTLQRACDVQVMQANLGPAIPVPAAIAERATYDGLQYDARFGAGSDVFGAMQRLVDKIDDRYKQ